MRLHNLGNLGAFPTGAGAAIPLEVGPKVSTSVYHILPTIWLPMPMPLTPHRWKTRSCLPDGAVDGKSC